jgi:glyoxylase-like metal-dependent hydrolase (beta-lactamase superfamily II)
MRLKRWHVVVIVIFVGLFVAKHFLLDTAAAPGAPYVIDVEALHRAATTGAPLPDHIEVEKVGEFSFNRTFVVPGDGWKLHAMVLLAYRVVWPDRSLLIDTALPKKIAVKLPGSTFDEAAFARVRAAMRRAQTVVFTHEHSDHIGGIFKAPEFASLAPRIAATSEQLDSRSLERKEFGAGELEQLKPLAYEGLHAIAPGVVLQKAPGHTPGTQLVYVETANGTRYLFVGDIAWSQDNIRLQVGRPGLATLLIHEDRPAVAAQLHALHELPKDIHVIVAHDPVELKSDLAAGLVRQGFSD